MADGHEVREHEEGGLGEQRGLLSTLTATIPTKSSDPCSCCCSRCHCSRRRSEASSKAARPRTSAPSTLLEAGKADAGQARHAVAAAGWRSTGSTGTAAKSSCCPASS
eukprot:9330615-Alexandrium_andersonii.AAC.1